MKTYLCLAVAGCLVATMSNADAQEFRYDRDLFREPRRFIDRTLGPEHAKLAGRLKYTARFAFHYDQGPIVLRGST
jgi:hypothetical protein